MAALGHEICRVVRLVTSHRYLSRARNLFQHHQRGIALCRSVGLEHLGVYDQSIAVLHQQIPVVTQLGFFALAFANFASGSVFDWCVSLDRFSPWKSTVALPGSSGGTAFLPSLR